MNKNQQTFRRVLTLVLALILALGCLSTVAFSVFADDDDIDFDDLLAAGRGGYCGENAIWKLDGKGVLTISGTGPMDLKGKGAPWYSYKDEVTAVVVEDGITAICDEAFMNMFYATSVSIGKDVKSIGEWAFSGWSSLTSLVIPDSVETIGDWAFSICEKLKSVVAGDGVTSIGYAAFDACTALETITFGTGLTFFDGYMFDYSCPALKNIVIDSENEALASENGVVYSKDMTELVYIPSGKTGNFAIPSTVTKICERALMHCYNLTSLTIPASVVEIELQSGCEKGEVETVYYVGSAADWEKIEKNDCEEFFAGKLKFVSAVKITAQPKTVVVPNGTRASTTITATGDGLKYAWYIKNKGTTAWAKSSLTSNEYYVTMKDAVNGRQIYCVVTDKYGNSVKSDVVTLYMGNPAKITKQPANVTGANGTTVKTSLTATGDGLTYKWYFKNKTATTYSVSSITTNTYSMTMDANRNGRSVYCVVTDKYGNSVKSNVVTLSMKTVAKITKQPVSVTVANGATAKTSLTATGDGLTYTWYFKNKTATTYSKSSITTNTYTMTMDATRNGRSVYCVVTDKYGNSVKSNVVTLNMGNMAKITKQPVSVTVANGATAKTSLAATGDGLTYTWYFKNKTATTYSKSSITTNTYTMTMDATRNGRSVYCVVTDKYGNSVKSNVVTLSMKTVAKITKQPVSVTVANGATAKTSLTATGDGLTYTWYFKNKTATTYSKSSITTNTYTMTMDATRNGRSVYCVVTDKYGNSVKSNVVTLNMGNMAKITKQPVSVTVANGATAKTSLTATGDGLTYTWYFKNKTATTYSKSSITTNTYTMTMDATRNGRSVYCVVTDKYGNSVKSNVVTLNMGNMAKITRQPTDASAPDGQKVTTSLTATGDGLQYAWYFKNKGATTFSKSSLTGNEYYVTMKATTEGRQVYCVVTDKYGNSVKSNVVTLTMEVKTPQIDWTMGSWEYMGLYCEGEYNEFSLQFAGDGTFGTVFVAYWQVLTQDEINEYLELEWSMEDFRLIDGEYCVNFHGTFRDFSVVNQNGNTFTLVVDYGEDGENIGTLVLELQEDKSLKIVSQENFVSDSALEAGKFFTWEEPEPMQMEMFTSYPKGAMGDFGDTLQFSVTAQGENLTYQWYKLVVDEETGEGREVLMPGVTGNTYSVVLTQENVGTRVMCKVFDDAYHYDQTFWMLLDHFVPHDSDYGFFNHKVTEDKQNLFFGVLFGGKDPSLNISKYRPLRAGEEPLENGDDHKDEDVVSTEYIEVDGIRYHMPFTGWWRPVVLSYEDGFVKASIREGDEEVAAIYFQRTSLNTLEVVRTSGTISDIPGYIENIKAGDVYQSEL